MIKKSDIIIASLIIIFSISGYFFTSFLYAGEQKVVVIEKNNREYGRYSMNKNETVNVDGHNVVRITKNYVEVVYADCPDKLDVKQGKISSVGSIIVCAPNKMTVRITGKSDVDAISY